MKSFLIRTVAVMLAAAVAVLGAIFVVDIYRALQEPDPLTIEHRSIERGR